MNISKKELLEDYYIDEFIVIMRKHSETQKKKYGKKEDETEELYADQFFA